MSSAFKSTHPVVLCTKNCGPERKAAEILAARIRKRSNIGVDLVPRGGSSLREADLVFVVGTRDRGGFIEILEDELSVDLPHLPDTEDLHPEGFAVV
ncbi:MAG: hypothetical protein HXS50_04960, partial [Theionarchaea archaeon]|nr:hypothetical protein [Theionarchaea archaeon]